MSSQEALPPGWSSEWDTGHQSWLYVETATGRTQWEPPIQGPMAPVDQGITVSPLPAQNHNPKRRQYAAGQTSAYYGETAPSGPDYVAANQGFQKHLNQPGGQLFTPGLAGDSQSYGMQQQPGAPGHGGYYGGYQQPEYPVNGAPHAQGYPAQPVAYGQPAYGQQQQPGPVAGMTNQFAQMGMGGGQTHGPLSHNTVNLLTAPPEPEELSRQPPPIRLPPGATLSQAPNVNADPSYLRCTLNAIPTSNSLLGKTKIPLGLIITPYRTIRDNEPEVPLVTDTLIPRCRRCKAYINPFVSFVDGGSRWKCCMCNMANDVPQLFDWDSVRNQPADRWQRAELNHSVIEFVAPQEYMVRAPPPDVYVILIDVSHNAVQSGMLATSTRSLLENLDRIPNQDGRTKISIVCFDVSLYFFSMPEGGTEPTMLVVSDTDDVFLPRPTDLLINLAESRTLLENLLTRVNEMFKDSHTVGSALGPALQAGFKMISSLGGQILVLSSSLPTIGAGALKARDDVKILGTSKESTLLQAASPFYKMFAIECSRSHISVSMFLFSNQYQDVASLAHLPHYTSGQTYFYPNFNAAKSEDAIKFAHEFGEVLAMPIMLEAIQRVRSSLGLRMASFHGNFFVRSTDLLSMPAVPTDQSYAIEVEIEDNITAPFVMFQVGLLHTTCHGERRVRVINLVLPTSNNLSEIFASADQIAIATLLANKVVERSITHKLEDARDALFAKMVDILTAYKASMTAAGAGASAQLAISDNLKMLPILILGLLKNVGVRQSSQIPPDLRAYAQALLTSLPSQQLIPYIHPCFYGLHNMAPEAGTVGEQGVIMPQPLPLTSERFEKHGLYLIEDGQHIFLWIGRDAVPQLVMDVFDLPSLEAVRGGKGTIPSLDNPFSKRVNAIIQKSREMRRGVYYPQLYIVKEDGDPPLRMWALSAMIQDRADSLPSYHQFITSLKDKVNGNNY